ncbi:DUF4145 domain-containing protein [Myxococcus sp. AS-1-15]|uniref:DUF4145 domain-containing protein n=1 Tax=Myxococcus sp. AS-1-15 TaxID=2874600 RepID=UPI001CC08B4F|nr:DUF4145 domain-containing protein [Myxococcus sp. AS-1-15]MBZ4400408.1 DUF4145 domain-containing protein [Myxococcus sp. AS-1-15]
MNTFVHQNAQGPCPHCGVTIHVKINESHWVLPLKRVTEEDGTSNGLDVHAGLCPSCEEPILDLVYWEKQFYDDPACVRNWTRAYPQLRRPRAPPPIIVPPHIRTEYAEAAAVEHVSQRAAAALLRRCLQSTLRDNGFKRAALEAEIEAAAQNGAIDYQLRTKLHIVRQVGNYSAHPIPDGGGDILQVEPGEVDALFGALDQAFEVFYVNPNRDREMLDAINKKLVAAGKPPILEMPTPPVPPQSPTGT